MSQDKHILFICSWYPHPGDETLGIFIRRHALAASANYRVSVVYAWGSDSVKEQQIHKKLKDNITEILVEYPRNYSKVPFIASLQKRQAYVNAIRTGCDEAVRLNRVPDILHVHVAFPAALAVDTVLRKYSVPLILTEHWSGYLPEDGNYGGRIMKYYTQKLVRKAALVTVVSERMKNEMMRHGLNGRYEILENAADEKLFFPPEATPENDGLKLLHVSSLVEHEKNISGLMQVMRLLNEENITLEIIGGSEKTLADAKATAAEAGLSGQKVIFRGPLAPELIGNAMRKADALILFSHFEGMPAVITESLCCGLPVIASGVGHIPQMVHAENGILVEPGNISACAESIRNFRKQAYDRKAISSAAIAQYGMKAIAEKLHQLYQSISN
ncbi:MAG: glycosyltransferase [Bacteroidia bacterium]